MKLGFPRQILKKISNYQNFMKILQVGAMLFPRTDRRTDITKIIVFFANFRQPKILLTLLFYMKLTKL